MRRRIAARIGEPQLHTGAFAKKLASKEGPFSRQEWEREPVFEFLGTDVLIAFLQVVLIDLVLAGDNAIVIGLAAAGLPEAQRGKAILIGIFVATALRILFAVLATQIMQIVGLLLAGGILLLWVCWKMWRELRASSAKAKEPGAAVAGTNAEG